MPYKRSSATYVRTCSNCGNAIGEYEARIYEGRSVHHVNACSASNGTVAEHDQPIAYTVPSEAEESQEIPDELVEVIHEVAESRMDDFPDSEINQEVDDVSAETVARPKRSHRKKKVAVAV